MGHLGSRVIRAIIGLNALGGCATNEPKLPPPEISAVKLQPTSTRQGRDSFAVHVCFSRALSKDETEPASMYRHRYGLRYRLVGRNGFRAQSWDTAPLQEGLLSPDRSCFYLTEESSHHPVGAWLGGVPYKFAPGAIDSLTVELYAQDEDDRESNYHFVSRRTFTGL